MSARFYKNHQRDKKGMRSLLWPTLLTIFLLHFPPCTALMIVDIVTGASQGIGKAVAEAIAGARSSRKNITDSSYQLILVGRNEERGRQAAQDIAASTGLHVKFEECNVGNFRQVQLLRDRLLSQNTSQDGLRIGILVNNAAECPRQQQLVSHARRKADGKVVEEKVDAQFATNVLGYHFMMRTFFGETESQCKDEPSYIVDIASNWAGDLDLSDLNFRKRCYDNDTAYRQSKQADRMLSVLWASRLQDRNVKVNACHPGDPCTTLSRALGYNMYASAPNKNLIESSHNPILHLCGLGSSTLSTTGSWFDGGITPRKDRFANQADKLQSLYDICESYCV